MAERRPLVEGLRADAAAEKEFVFAARPGGTQAGHPPALAPSPEGNGKPGASAGRTPLTVRFRADFAAALKRASLERQLNGQSPSTLQDILEEAVEPWLRQHGYLS